MRDSRTRHFFDRNDNKPPGLSVSLLMKHPVFRIDMFIFRYALFLGDLELAVKFVQNSYFWPILAFRKSSFIAGPKKNNGTFQT